MPDIIPTRMQLLNVEEPHAVLYDLEDPTNGISVLGPLRVPKLANRTRRVKGAGYTGSARIGSVIPDDGTLGFGLRFKGSWAQVEANYVAIAMGMAHELPDTYLLEYELNGVRWRYYCDEPPIIDPEPLRGADVAHGRRVIDVEFLVQPLPEVSVGGP